MKAINLTILGLGLVVSGCHKKAVSKGEPAASQSTAAEVTEPAEVLTPAPPKPLPDAQSMDDDAMGGMNADRSPHHSWIIGTITAIQPASSDPGLINECGQYPCRATVTVEQITQRGSTFHHQFAVGDELDAYFELTLAKSSEVFSDMSTSLPGLAVGDRFEAELFESPDNPSVRIKLYEKK